MRMVNAGVLKPMTCPNGIKKTFIVSTPRSGHHLLIRGLDVSLNHKMVYSEYYNCAHNFANCDHVNVQKSHDFELDMPITDGFQYVVLYRDKDETMKSWFEASDSGGNLNNWTLLWSAYYDGFMHKWVNNAKTNKLVLKYSELIENKAEIVEKVCEFMGVTPNHLKIEDWREREDLIHSSQWTYSKK